MCEAPTLHGRRSSGKAIQSAADLPSFKILGGWVGLIRASPRSKRSRPQAQVLRTLCNNNSWLQTGARTNYRRPPSSSSGAGCPLWSAVNPSPAGALPKLWPPKQKPLRHYLSRYASTNQSCRPAVFPKFCLSTELRSSVEPCCPAEHKNCPRPAACALTTPSTPQRAEHKL